MSTKPNETYVFEDTEVKLTGRVAVRNTSRTQVTLYEITPVNQLTVGGWLKWVRMDALYVIQSHQEQKNDHE